MPNASGSDAAITKADPRRRNGSESSPPNDSRCNAAGVISKIVAIVTQHSPAACSILASDGSSSKARVSMAMS